MKYSRSKQKGHLGKGLRAGMAVSVAVFGVAAVTAAPASAATVLVEESFTNSQVKNPAVWKSPDTPDSFQPCLTAATADVPNGLKACAPAQRDPDGKGAFRLTDNTRGKSGVLLLDQAEKSDRGIDVQFDMFQYNAVKGQKDKGADGLSMFLIDGNQTSIKAGDTGGYLAYRNLKGAVLGVGFDEFGNFSNGPVWDRNQTVKGDKGPGVRPNAVAIRGRDNSDKPGKVSYQYLTGVNSPSPLAVDDAKTRDQAKRTVHLSVTPQKRMSISIDFNDGKGPQRLIENYDVGANADGTRDELPATIKLGFGAATGDSAAIHEVAGFKLSALKPDLVAKLSASPTTFKAGETATYQLDVTNKQVAGPTSGPVTATFDVPAGLTATSASGDGWTCPALGQKITCTRDGVLRPGQSAPPIKIAVKVASNAPDSVTAKVNFTTSEEDTTTLDDNTATLTTKVEKSAITTGLRVRLISNPNPYVPGGVLSYTATFSNDGPSAATAAGADVDWPALMDGIAWTCVASAGSTCPAVGTGDISKARINIAAGGSVVFTVRCLLPITAKGAQRGTATVTTPVGAVDPNCKNTCTSTDTNQGTTLVPIKG